MTISQIPYCELQVISNTFLSLNVLSSLVYLISAILIFRSLVNRKLHTSILVIVPALVFFAGLGSILYHAILSPLTLLIDAIPIYLILCILVFLLVLSRTGDRFKAAMYTLSIVAIEGTVTVIIPRIELIPYVANVLLSLILVLIGGWYIIRPQVRELPKELIYAYNLYSIGILARVMEKGICSAVPIGTHFIWHVSAAFAFYFAVKAINKLELQKQ